MKKTQQPAAELTGADLIDDWCDPSIADIAVGKTVVHRDQCTGRTDGRIIGQVDSLHRGGHVIVSWPAKGWRAAPTDERGRRGQVASVRGLIVLPDDADWLVTATVSTGTDRYRFVDEAEARAFAEDLDLHRQWSTVTGPIEVTHSPLADEPYSPPAPRG